MRVIKIESKSVKSGSDVYGFVLAKNDEEYITWAYASFNGVDSLSNVNNFNSDAHNCYNGHYFHGNLSAALADYNNRIKAL